MWRLERHRLERHERGCSSVAGVARLVCMVQRTDMYRTGGGAGGGGRHRASSRAGTRATGLQRHGTRPLLMWLGASHRLGLSGRAAGGCSNSSAVDGRAQAGLKAVVDVARLDETPPSFGSVSHPNGHMHSSQDRVAYVQAALLSSAMGPTRPAPVKELYDTQESPENAHLSSGGMSQGKL